MTASTVESAINDRMDHAGMLSMICSPRRAGRRGVQGTSALSTAYPVHSLTLTTVFAGTRPVDAIVFDHDLLGPGEPKLSSRSLHEFRY
jgi:hypothetical protein